MRTINIYRLLSMALIVCAALLSISACCKALGQQREELPKSMSSAGRLTLLPLEHPLRAGEKNEIRLELHGPPADYFDISLEKYQVDGSLQTSDSIPNPPILRRSNGSAYVVLTPSSTGKSRLRALAQFSDGRLDVWNLDTDVVMTSNAATDFKIMHDMSAYRLLLAMEGSRQAVFSFSAKFEGSDVTVSIPPDDVQLDVIPDSSGSPVVKIDPATRTVTSLHTGHSLIVASFRGLKAANCVVVVQSLRGYATMVDCHELLPEGVSLPGRAPTGLLPKVRPREQNR